MRTSPLDGVRVPSSDALRDQLKEVEAELGGLDDRRRALEKAAEDLRTAIDSLTALEGGSSTTRRRRSTPKAPRPTVTPDDLVGALRSAGGRATVDELVAALGLPDGRSLNGARRIAVDAGTVAYEDRTYTLTDAA